MSLTNAYGINAHTCRNNDIVLVAKSKILIKTQWLTNGVRIYYVGSSMVSFMAAAAATIATTLHAIQHK